MRDPSIEKGRDGLYYLKVPVVGRRRREWVSTGERDLNRARAVVTEFGADRLIHLAHARALTHETIAIATTGRRITWADTIKLWLEWMSLRGSARTAEVYLKHIRQLVELHGAAAQPMSFISERQLHDFVNDGLRAANTAASRLAALKSIYRYANAKALIVGNPAELLEIDHRALTVDQKEVQHVEPVTEEQYQTLLAALPRPQRDWVVLAYCCGLRLGDAICLEFPSFTAEHIVVWPSKTRRAKRLALPLTDPLIARPELQELIADLLGRRPTRQTYVWPAHQLEFSTPRRARFSQEFRRRFEHAGIADRTFHSLRVSFARRLQAAGKTIYQIAQAMAHSSIETTKIYTGETGLTARAADSTHPAAGQSPPARSGSAS